MSILSMKRTAGAVLLVTVSGLILWPMIDANGVKSTIVTVAEAVVLATAIVVGIRLLREE